MKSKDKQIEELEKENRRLDNIVDNIFISAIVLTIAMLLLGIYIGEKGDNSTRQQLQSCQEDLNYLEGLVEEFFDYPLVLDKHGYWGYVPKGCPWVRAICPSRSIDVCKEWVKEPIIIDCDLY